MARRRLQQAAGSAIMFCAYLAEPGRGWAAGDGASSAAKPLADLPLQHDVESGWDGAGTPQLLIFGAILLLWLAWLAWRHGPRGVRALRQGGWRGLTMSAQRGDLRVVQSFALTPRASLHVVRWDGREWLVGCTEHGMTELGRRPEATGPSRAAAETES